MIPPIPATVLVVDDDVDIRGLVMSALQRSGFSVLGAADGQAALDVVDTETVSLVVLDMGLPKMSGPDVVRVLRARPDTATLPILLMTGSGHEYSVIEGLDAGADDFLPKPVRLDELVARVKAHLRMNATWSTVVEDEFRTRTGVVTALAQLTISSVPEEAAESIVRELARRTDSDFIAVQQVGGGGQVQELATYSRSTGAQRGGDVLASDQARAILARARDGPWVEEVEPLAPGHRTSSFDSAALELAVDAPFYSGDDLVGLLTIGVSRDPRTAPHVRRSKLLAAALDYASVLTTIAGPAFASQRDIAASRSRLRQVLIAGEFGLVFQPIVELESRAIVGFEALTRFADGTAPDVRFEEAAGLGLGQEFELGTIRAALRDAEGLPPDAFLSINVSPFLVVDGDQSLRQLIGASTRSIVLELTEHVPIDDYPVVRKALAKLGDVGLAVDDAGAGFASFRHIVELRPRYAKLDISLVRGIDDDDLRQALAAGLQYFAYRTGCRLIAEGVETPAEADTLQRLGVEFGQGYLFGRPEAVA